MEGNDTPSQKPIKSLETAFEIIELIADSDGIGLSEIAEEIDYSKSTVHYYLGTLERHRFVVNAEDGYRLGLRFLEYGGRARADRELVNAAREPLRVLADETGETAWLAVVEGGYCVFLARVVGGEAETSYRQVGRECPVHSTAFGKAILAHLSRERVDEIISRRGLPAVTKRTLTDPERLDDELAAVREYGIAFDDREETDAYRNVAAPIVETDGSAYGAIGVAGPIDRIDDPYRNQKARRFMEGLSEHVRRAARHTASTVAE